MTEEMIEKKFKEIYFIRFGVNLSSLEIEEKLNMLNNLLKVFINITNSAEQHLE